MPTPTLTNTSQDTHQINYPELHLASSIKEIWQKKKIPKTEIFELLHVFN